MATVGIAYRSFIELFRTYFPDIELIDPKWDATKLKNYKLIIFSGGEDINPGIYAQENRYSSYNSKRDDAETTIYEKAWRLIDYGEPIKLLGVCRGHQLLNALRGGNLYQDIYFETKTKHGGHHKLDVISSSGFMDMFAESGVNSLHHQAVRSTGKGLRATSAVRLANGGGHIVESCEGPNIITVQFHPEMMPPKMGKPFFDYITQWAFQDSPKPTKTKVTMNSLRGVQIKEEEEPMYIAHREEPTFRGRPEPEPIVDDQPSQGNRIRWTDSAFITSLRRASNNDETQQES